jgi:DNA end-binding protein Ku
MAKAKQAQAQAQTQVATPVAAPAADPKANVADISSKLKDMLNQSAAEQRGDADVTSDVPQRKIAGGRATWSGVMELPNGQGGVLAKFALKTCTAVDDETFERNMFHSAECLNKLKQEDMVCTGCNTKVSKKDAVKGVVRNGAVVLISDEELAALIPQNEKTMRITEYVESHEIDPIYLEKTEFIYPQDDKANAAKTTFGMLEGMLRRTGRVAKGIRVSRGKQQEFVVRPYNSRGLSINVLRAEYEVRSTTDLWEAIDVPSEAVEMFAAVAEADLKPFTPAKRDQYLANANKLVSDKMAGIKTECPTPEPEQKGTDDLLAALKKAVAAKQGK